MQKFIAFFFGIIILLAALLYITKPDTHLAVAQTTDSQASSVSEDEEYETEPDPSDFTMNLDESAPVSTPAADNPIVIENQKPGNKGWTLYGSTISDDTNNQIKGYASKVSVKQGNDIELKVSVNPAQSFTMEVYRMGWYKGFGARLMKTVGPLNGIRQSSCPMNSYGTTECRWSTSYNLTIPNDWLSGAYMVKLRNNRGYANWINFTVKDDRSADFLFQNSVNTWEAYNDWGGKSLYVGSPHAVKVSFDRPYSGYGTRLLSWENHFIRFMERNGYDVSYTTDVDTDVSAAKLLNYKSFLSVGHDEYWTWEMRDHVENARNRGVNLGFFGGNDSYWQIRYENSSTGEPNRTIVGYKDLYRNDPYYSSSDSDKRRRTTTLWRNSPVNRSEQQMIGTIYVKNLGSHDNNLDLTVKRADSFAFTGTGLSNGDKIPHIYGYEYNQLTSSYPMPSGVLELAEGTRSGYPSASSTIYTAPSDALVFSAGSTDWSWGLDDLSYHRANAKIQKITANILDKFASN